ncbi:MAG: WG repeat-containing protein, partial [Capnocytophaga leadbetteri]
NDGEFISADESKFLNGAGRMNFDLNLDVEGRIANLKFKELVEHGELKWVQDPTGQAPARVELLFSNNVGSQNVSLQSGESMDIGELSITFNAEPKSKNFIYIKSKDGKWGFINQKGEQIIPFLYDDASYFTEGLALVKQGAKYGYINDKNETVFPFIYDDGALFENGKAWVQIGDKQFQINKLGIEIK